MKLIVEILDCDFPHAIHANGRLVRCMTNIREIKDTPTYDAIEVLHGDVGGGWETIHNVVRMEVFP